VKYQRVQYQRELPSGRLVHVGNPCSSPGEPTRRRDPVAAMDRPKLASTPPRPGSRSVRRATSGAAWVSMGALMIATTRAGTRTGIRTPDRFMLGLSLVGGSSCLRARGLKQLACPPPHLRSRVSGAAREARVPDAATVQGGGGPAAARHGGRTGWVDRARTGLQPGHLGHVDLTSKRVSIDLAKLRLSSDLFLRSMPCASESFHAPCTCSSPCWRSAPRHGRARSTPGPTVSPSSVRAPAAMSTSGTTAIVGPTIVVSSMGDDENAGSIIVGFAPNAPTPPECRTTYPCP